MTDRLPESNGNSRLPTARALISYPHVEGSLGPLGPLVWIAAGRVRAAAHAMLAEMAVSLIRPAAGCALAAVMLAFAASTARAPAGPEHTVCGLAARAERPSLKVAGDEMAGPRGQVIRPYGISVVGGPETKYWATSEKSSMAQIVAARRSWHANTVRIQVSEKYLFKHPTLGYSYNVGFAASLNRLVCAVLELHVIPVINDNTLFTGNRRAPTERTVRFWEFMSARYGRLPVIFDVFNEPRLIRRPKSGAWMTPDEIWRLWQRGGRVGGVRYVGMQALVNVIRRKEHLDTVIWAEMPEWSPLSLLPSHLLRGNNIVYAFHKRTLEQGAPWLRDIADLARRGIPLVNGEWAQYASTKRPWECFGGAHKSVPRYLAQLRELSIGLIAWSLQPGSLVKGVPGRDTVHDGNYRRYETDPGRLVTPSMLEPRYACDELSLGQGAGALLMDYFKRNSAKPPAALVPDVHLSGALAGARFG